MAQYMIQDTTMEAIGDAIREQTGGTEALSPAQMAEEIRSNLGDVNGLIERTTTDIKYNGVTEVAPFAFYSYTTLNSIELPACTSVGNSAFVSCTGLTSISLPNCTSASTSAFTGCKNIVNATIGFSGTITAGNFPFKVAYSTALATVNLPNCEMIGSSAFKGYTKLTTISAPVCTSAYTQAFSGCTALDTVYLPECTSASTAAFTGCKSITNATLGFSELTSTNFPFKSARAIIEEVHFPKCVSIGSRVFAGS